MVDELKKVRLQITDEVQRPSIHSVVALGIGCIHHSQVSQYQYACILEIHQLLHIENPIEIFDPAMDYVLHMVTGTKQMDAQIVSHFGNKILTVNEKGKREVTEETLFYMPHCSFDLYALDRSITQI